MENVKASTNAEQQRENAASEAENFDVFIKEMCIRDRIERCEIS